MVQPQPLITGPDKTQLKRSLRKDLKAQVKLRLFTQKPSILTIPGRQCPYCPQTQQLMEELAAVSPKLDLEVLDFYNQTQVARDQGVQRIPAITIGDDQPPRIKFYGFPLGLELAFLLESIKTVSRGVTPLTMETRKGLKQVNQPVHIQVFVTPP